MVTPSRNAKAARVGVQGEGRLSLPSWPFDPLHGCHALPEINSDACGTWCQRKFVSDVLQGQLWDAWHMHPTLQELQAAICKSAASKFHQPPWRGDSARHRPL